MPPHTITAERTKGQRIVCTVTIHQDAYTAAEKTALQALGQQITIKGFRPGAAPENMLREKIPQEQLFEQTIRTLLQTVIPQAVDQENIQPVIPPKVEVRERFPLKLQISFVEKPLVTIKKMDAIKVEKKESNPSQKDIDMMIESVLQEHRTLTPSNEAAKNGDQVTLNFHATDENKQEVPGMKAENYAVIIGSKQLLPGFEEELIDLKSGESKDCALILPEKFQQEALAGKSVTFHVTVVSVENVTLPALTDEFAKEKLQAESAEAFKAMVANSMKAQEEQFLRNTREKELMEKIQQETDVDIADELIEEEVRAMADEWAAQLERQGKTIADVLEKQRKKPEEVEEEMRKDAIQRWKLRLGIGKIIEEKGITVSNEELEQAWQQFQANIPEGERTIAKQEWDKRGNLYQEVRWRTMVDKVIDELLA